MHRTPRSAAVSAPTIGRCECTHDRPHKFTATARPRPAQPPKRGKFRHRKGPDPRPGPDAHALGRLPWLAGFPARERRLRPRRLIVAPQIDCAPERRTTGRKCISLRPQPLYATAPANRQMRRVTPRRIEGLSIVASRSNVPVLRLLSPYYSKTCTIVCPTAAKNLGAQESTKGRAHHP